MEVIALNASGLESFISSAQFQTAQHLPISTRRAIAQLSNPRATPKDILLIIIQNENAELLAYLGLLPDDIFKDKKQTIHFAWLSCIWVNPDARGQKIAQQLLMSAWEHWDGKLMGTEFVPSLKTFYEKSGYFSTFKKKIGIRAYFGADFKTWLPPKYAFFAKIKPLLRILDNFMNHILVFKLQNYPDYRNYILPEWPSDTEVLFKTLDPSQTFHRSQRELDWIWNYPWLQTDSDPEQDKYYFSLVDPDFEQVLLGIRNEQGEIRTLISLLKRGKTLKIPYFFSYSESMPLAMRILMNYIRQKKIASLVTYHVALVAFFQGQLSTAYFTRRANRIYMASDSLSFFEVNGIFDGDGDCAFT
jgi:GNAT superfamily N-acetyltransferase